MGVHITIPGTPLHHFCHYYGTTQRSITTHCNLSTITIIMKMCSACPRRKHKFTQLLNQLTLLALAALKI